MLRDNARSGCSLALPPMVDLICALGWVRDTPLQPAGRSAGTPSQLPGDLAQGSEAAGNESELPRNSSLTLGARKPCDQAARTNRLSDGCHFRAARPVDALAKWLTKEPAGPTEPGIPPFHSNLDQRLATSRSSILKPGASATSGISNSMYSALVLVRPSVGWVTLPVVLPEDTVESGWKKPFSSRYS